MSEFSFVDCDFRREKTDHEIDGYKANEFLNLANVRAMGGGATQPSRISSLSRFFHEEKPNSLDEWIAVLRRRIPDQLQRAENDIAKSLRRFQRRAAILTGTNPPSATVRRPYHPNIRIFVDDLTGLQTYQGKQCEVRILRDIANKEGEEDYQPSSEQDESDNIDGMIKEDTYSVKPETFLQKKLQTNPNYSLRELGTDYVVEYSFGFNPETCEVTINYNIHNFTRDESRNLN
jgi:hypothetical protein